jgi:hypothetical protein
MTLFTSHLPEYISLRVLDVFLLHGMDHNKVLFDIMLAYLKVIEEEALLCTDG